MNANLDDVLKFEDFFQSFRDEQNRYKYRKAIKDIFDERTNVLYISYEDVLSFDTKLAANLVEKPETSMEKAEEALSNFLERMSYKSSNNEYFVRIRVESTNSPLEVPLFDLNSTFLAKLILCKGKVVKKSLPEMRLKIANFECMTCGFRFEILQPSLKIRKPSFCSNPRCKAKSTSDFRFISKDSDFYDYQIVTIQDVKITNKKKLKVMVTHDLVDVANIGDIIEIIGIYSTEYDYLKTRKKDSLFRGMIEANNIIIISNQT